MSYIWIMCCTDAGLTWVFAQTRLYVTKFTLFWSSTQNFDARQLFRGQLLTPERKTVPMKQVPVRALVYRTFPLVTKQHHDTFCILRIFSNVASVGANKTSMMSNSTLRLSDSILHFYPPQLTCGKLLTSGRKMQQQHPWGYPPVRARTSHIPPQLLLKHMMMYELQPDLVPMRDRGLCADKYIWYCIHAFWFSHYIFAARQPLHSHLLTSERKRQEQ